MDVKIGINDTNRLELVRLLNVISADLHVIYIKTRNFHWNVKGPLFKQHHELFEEQYNQLEESIDEIAERVKMLGGKSIGTMKEFVELSRQNEAETRNYSANEMLAELLKSHETFITNLREDINKTDELGDVGTEDQLTGLIRDHEKIAWMIRSSIE